MASPSTNGDDDGAHKFTDRDRHFMRLALREAEGALDEGEVPVGCVIVMGDRVVASGRNRTNASKNVSEDRAHARASERSHARARTHESVA